MGLCFKKIGMAARTKTTFSQHHLLHKAVRFKAL
jgi:hypothetical protein